jgi:hypothetical protein
LVERTKKVERNKRFLFLGIAGAGTALTVMGSGFLGIIGIGAGAYLGYDWFKYRVKNGMRF